MYKFISFLFTATIPLIFSLLIIDIFSRYYDLSSFQEYVKDNLEVFWGASYVLFRFIVYDQIYPKNSTILISTDYCYGFCAMIYFVRYTLKVHEIIEYAKNTNNDIVQLCQSIEMSKFQSKIIHKMYEFKKYFIS